MIPRSVYDTVIRRTDEIWGATGRKCPLAERHLDSPHRSWCMQVQNPRRTCPHVPRRGNGQASPDAPLPLRPATPIRSQRKIVDNFSSCRVCMSQADRRRLFLMEAPSSDDEGFDGVVTSDVANEAPAPQAPPPGASRPLRLRGNLVLPAKYLETSIATEEELACAEGGPSFDDHEFYFRLLKRFSPPRCLSSQTGAQVALAEAPSRGG
eukprot:Polyplicarium_translucidae@DN2386_c0_g1_i3.p1